MYTCFLLLLLNINALFRFTMRRNSSKANWICSATPTWWISLWMCTKTFTPIRRSPIVSKIECTSLSAAFLSSYTFSCNYKRCLHTDVCCNLLSALREKRTAVVAQLKQLQSETEPIVKMFEDPETTRQMQSTRWHFHYPPLQAHSYIGNLSYTSTKILLVLTSLFSIAMSVVEMEGCCLTICQRSTM